MRSVYQNTVEKYHERQKQTECGVGNKRAKKRLTHYSSDPAERGRRLELCADIRSVFTYLRKVLDLRKAFDQTLNSFISFIIFFFSVHEPQPELQTDFLIHQKCWDLYKFMCCFRGFSPSAAADAPSSQETFTSHSKRASLTPRSFFYSAKRKVEIIIHQLSQRFYLTTRLVFHQKMFLELLSPIR